jgi:ribonucleoside-triphosphate reductase
VVGYLRPVKQWNDGKQAEFRRRKTFVAELPEIEGPAPAFPTGAGMTFESRPSVDSRHHLTA